LEGAGWIVAFQQAVDRQAFRTSRLTVSHANAAAPAWRAGPCAPVERSAKVNSSPCPLQAPSGLLDWPSQPAMDCHALHRARRPGSAAKAPFRLSGATKTGNVAIERVLAM